MLEAAARIVFLTLKCNYEDKKMEIEKQVEVLKRSCVGTALSDG